MSGSEGDIQPVSELSVEDAGVENNKIAISDIPGYSQLTEKKNRNQFSSNECIKAIVPYDFNKFLKGGE